jgi:eukaryotic-like serine/threonine-protein kinase
VQSAAPAAVAPGGDAGVAAAGATAPAGANAPAGPNAPAAEANVSAPQKQALVSNGRGQWRVIAFTYDRESQAQQKAASIAQKHSDLRPEVFTPNGRAPYLVTVGGMMSRDEAFALVRKVRGEGLPRDSYAQNYRGR